MKNILCLFVPFCSPVSPPYSLAYLTGFLKRNIPAKQAKISVLDLNAEVHTEYFPKKYEAIKKALKNQKSTDYAAQIKEVKETFGSFAKKENYKARKNEESQVLNFCMQHILEKKPDVITMSVVYNSQAFFAQKIAEELKKQGIELLVGGPAVTQQLKKIAMWLPHEVALAEHITGKKADMNQLDCRRITDYSLFDASKYFIPELVIPIKTTSCCYYQQCTFCTHHMNGQYIEYDLADIEESIRLSQTKKIFFIDDMIHKERLLHLAKMLKPLNVEWMCQLRPTQDLDQKTLHTLHEAGLRIVIWGVESGNDRVLKKMKKGTRTTDIEQVLQASASVGIHNVTYIMFGFPTETKEEFKDTIHFLQRNTESIELVSTAVFGLQEEAPIYDNPQDYDIIDIQTHKREKLPDKIDYTAKKGLQTQEAKNLRKKYKNTLESINKRPKEMNIYREHMLVAINITHS